MLAHPRSFPAAFPHTRRAFWQYFALVAKSGAKLHIADPRPCLSDSYFLKRPDGDVIEIDRNRFLSASDGEIAGVEADDPRDVFALSQAGARMLKTNPLRFQRLLPSSASAFLRY